MSGTVIKNGQRILDALDANMSDALNGKWLFFTVGELCRWANISKPTARKYIQFMIEQGFVELARETDYGPIYHYNLGATNAGAKA